MEASINTLTECMKALESPDRMPTFTEGADAKAWLCQFDIHANGKGWTSPAKLAGMLPMYFNSTVAAEWYAHLPQATKDNFQLLREALIEEYRPKAARRWEAENTLRGRKQRHSEEVCDFVKEVRRTGQLIGLGEETLVNIVLNNLLPAARAMITTMPANLDEILATPVGKGEVPLASTSAMPGVSNEQFARLLDVLDKQSAQIASLQQSQAVNNIQPTDQTRQGDNRHQPSYHNPPRHNNQPLRHFNSSSQPPRRHGNGQGSCYACGGDCRQRSECPAQGVTCTYCGGQNHLFVMCFRRNQQQPQHPMQRYNGPNNDRRPHQR